MIGCFAGVVGAAAILWRKRCFRLVVGVYLPLLKITFHLQYNKCVGIWIHVTSTMVSNAFPVLVIGRKEQFWCTLHCNQCSVCFCGCKPAWTHKVCPLLWMSWTGDLSSLEWRINLTGLSDIRQKYVLYMTYFGLVEKMMSFTCVGIRFAYIY